MGSLKVQLSSQPVMYKVVRNILFLFPTEWIHYFSMNCMKIICSIPGMKSLVKKIFNDDDPALHSNIGKLRFKNPIGLGAGFDKNAKYLRELETLGFGFIEIGTVTPLPQKGNDKPRLFRLPKDNALINRMGFNNDGVKTVAKRLKKWKEKESRVLSRNSGVDSPDSPLTLHLPIAIGTRLIIGGNIGKNKVTSNEDAWKDYETCFKELHPYVDYFVVNVSSPNTPGLRELQEKESLRKILMHLQMINNGKAISKPIFLKIAPDLTQEQIDDVVELSLEIKLDGLVATNTTIGRDRLITDPSQLSRIGMGGLSGLPLKDKATEIVRYISIRSNGAIPIIASGGIFDGQHAKEKLDAGATLLQVWTGFIYEGPRIVKKICKALKDEQIPA
jgi:dihydroorotate dehydrogenase